MAESIRSFIAIPLEEQIKILILDVQSELKKLGCDIKWVEPKNMHLTLKFLGYVHVNQIKPISSVMDKQLENANSLETSFTKIGCFPSNKHPRVIWLGINDQNGTIKNWANTFEDEMHQLGFEKERRKFEAHITLGRIKSGKNLKNLVDKISNYQLQAKAEIAVDQINLYQSTLSQDGPTYNILHSVPLSN